MRERFGLYLKKYLKNAFLSGERMRESLVLNVVIET